MIAPHDLTDLERWGLAPVGARRMGWSGPAAEEG